MACAAGPGSRCRMIVGEQQIGIVIHQRVEERDETDRDRRGNCPDEIRRSLRAALT